MTTLTGDPILDKKASEGDYKVDKDGLWMMQDGDWVKATAIPASAISNFHMVKHFHEVAAMGVSNFPNQQTLSDRELMEIWTEMIQEEFMNVQKGISDLSMLDTFHSLLDLLYVTYGLGVLLGFPMDDGFKAIQKARLDAGELAMIAAQSLGTANPVAAPSAASLAKPGLWDILKKAYNRIMPDNLCELGQDLDKVAQVATVVAPIAAVAGAPEVAAAVPILKTAAEVTEGVDKALNGPNGSCKIPEQPGSDQAATDQQKS